MKLGRIRFTREMALIIALAVVAGLFAAFAATPLKYRLVKPYTVYSYVTFTRILRKTVTRTVPTTVSVTKTLVLTSTVTRRAVSWRTTTVRLTETLTKTVTRTEYSTVVLPMTTTVTEVTLPPPPVAKLSGPSWRLRNLTTYMCFRYTVAPSTVELKLIAAGRVVYRDFVNGTSEVCTPVSKGTGPVPGIYGAIAVWYGQVVAKVVRKLVDRVSISVEKGIAKVRNVGGLPIYIVGLLMYYSNGTSKVVHLSHTVVVPPGGVREFKCPGAVRIMVVASCGGKYVLLG